MLTINENSNLLSLLDDLIEKSVLQAGSKILDATDLDELNAAATTIVRSFGADNSVSLADSKTETKLISSFKSNLTLLIQKTWVESTDADIKAKILYQLEEFTTLVSKSEWEKAYTPFLKIIYDAVYLMFGNQARKADFLEYAFRVDPEFGLFWWYIQLLPQVTTWPAEKCRISVLLGMYFLANY